MNEQDVYESRWIEDPGPGRRAKLVIHLDGVAWYDAPLPPRIHRHRAQTKGFDAERCACGAIRLYGFGPWVNRNERRKSERRERKGSR